MKKAINKETDRRRMINISRSNTPHDNTRASLSCRQYINFCLVFPSSLSGQKLPLPQKFYSTSSKRVDGLAIKNRLSVLRQLTVKLTTQSRTVL